MPSRGSIAASLAPQAATVDPAIARLLAKAGGDGEVAVIARLRPRVDPGAITGPSESARRMEVINRLRSANEASLQSLVRGLDGAIRAGDVREMKALWIINGLSLKATAAGIEQLAKRPEVMSIEPDGSIEAPVAPASAVGEGAAPEDNLNAIGVPAVWDLGFGGLG